MGLLSYEGICTHSLRCQQQRGTLTDKHIDTPLGKGLHTRKNKRISRVPFVLLLIKMDACGDSDHEERERKDNDQQDSRQTVQARPPDCWLRDPRCSGTAPGTDQRARQNPAAPSAQGTQAPRSVLGRSIPLGVECAGVCPRPSLEGRRRPGLLPGLLGP